MGNETNHYRVVVITCDVHGAGSFVEFIHWSPARTWIFQIAGDAVPDTYTYAIAKSIPEWYRYAGPRTRTSYPDTDAALTTVA